LKENSASFFSLKGLRGADWTKHSDIGLAVAVSGILFVLLFPVNVFFIDLLLAISITISILILMTTLFIIRPLDLSVFPTVLLVTAIMRLALNIASTRLILANGHTGPAAAGHVINAFGNFVMEGNIVIGLIVFAIITIINFVVITKGSGRIAEVAARFSLDAMPGKQMAIDADLSAGLIKEEEARARRKALEDESTFFGAMDGANKFVRGDAIAGLLIIFINLIGGIVIGMVEKKLPFSAALRSYSLLTIGDGLVSQVPALIVSLAAGLLVSKSGVVGSTDKAIFGQFGKFPNALWMASIVIGLMAFMPGIPAGHFIFVAIGTASLGFISKYAEKISPKDDEMEKQKVTAEKEKEEEESISSALHIDSIKLELGYNLLSLINYQKGHKLTDQIKALRKQIARDLGFIIPSVRIHDNMQLPTNNYVIRIKNIECGRGEIHPDKFLIMDPQGGKISIPGDETKEPAFGLPALWIEEKFKEEASFKNYTVVDPPTVITTHLTEIIKENITELLSYSETQKLLSEIGEDHKKLVAETIPDKVTASSLQRILQNLLAEGISVRDLPLILEAISEAVTSTKNVTLVTEMVRSRLARQISHALCDEEGYVRVISLAPRWERDFADAITEIAGDERHLSLEPTKMQEFMDVAKKKLDELALQGITPAILVSPLIRPYVRSVIVRFNPSTSVISQNELFSRAKIKTFGQIA